MVKCGWISLRCLADALAGRVSLDPPPSELQLHRHDSLPADWASTCASTEALDDVD